MRYLMENVILLEDGVKKKVSVLVKNGKIHYLGSPLSRLNVMKIEVQAYTLTPSFVFFSPNIPYFSFDQFKSFLSRQFLLKGCGTLISFFSINYLSEFDKSASKKKLSFMNSPIDYILGLKIHALNLTPSIITKCNSAGIPIVFVEFSMFNELNSIPWGWIKTASFPQNPILVPFFENNIRPLQKRKLLKKWTELLLNEKIHHLPQPLPVNEPLKLEVIKKIGLYPKKGVLKQGGEVNYNLFLNTKLSGTTSQKNKEPDISVTKGKFSNINRQPIFRPGFGEELKIRQTALFR